jgi:Heterokaryon incompatibility protein (HET)
MGPEMDKVYEILNRRQIPVITFKFLLDDKGIMHINLDVSNSENTLGYVAISHVWADGLGNQTKNELPLCQIFRVAHLSRQVSGKESVPVWIDTLCVPRDRDQRVKALDLMNDTYKFSDHVLVLDAGLQCFKAHRHLSTSLLEINVETAEQIRMGIVVEVLLRIACSSWATRLWTLPEGQVGRLLHFQFSDEAVEIGDIFYQLGTWPFVGTSLVNDLRVFLTRLRPRLRTQGANGQSAEDPALLRWPTGSLDGRFIAMLHAIEWRFTSRQVDEVLCMAIQLNLDVKTITNISEDDAEGRMHALLRQIPYIPGDLLFTNGPRLQQSPFRWAPRNLLGYKDHFGIVPAAKPDAIMGQSTPQGLRIRYSSFQIAGGPMPDSQFFFFSTIPVNVHGRGQPREDYFMKLFGMMIETGTPDNLPFWHESGLDELLQGDDITVLDGRTGFHGNPATLPDGKVGLVIKVERRERGMIFGTPLLTVVLFEIPDMFPQGNKAEVRFGVEFPPRNYCIS